MTHYAVFCDICGQAVEYGGLASHKCHRPWVRRVQRLLGMVRLRLWSRGLARCSHCACMTRQEWEAMCDCWLADTAWWRRFVRKERR